MKRFLLALVGTTLHLAAKPPNVLVFITEDQSADLGCLGTKGLATPNLDAFAKSGTNFTRAFALSPVCSPSKMALLTGTYPHTNSALRNVRNYGVNFPLPKKDPSDLKLGGVHEDLPTLIELLRAKNIFTAVTSKTHVQPIRKFPFDKGYPRPSRPEDAEHIVADVVQRSAKKPFFLWYNIGSPHLPFRNVPKVHGMWDPEAGINGDGGVTNVDAEAIEVPNCYPDTTAVRQDIADYYGAIQCLDTLFQSVLETLREKGELENTLIIFTSDHGIGLHRAKQSIYAAGLHIPLLIQAPNSKSNQTISHPVSHLDLSPTILDYFGMPQPKSMIGKSLRPILEGKQASFPGRPAILTACHRYYSARAVTDGRFYYIKNLTQSKGGSLENPHRVLNTDQYQSGPPWFNRTYEATVAAEGTLPHTLLKQIVEGHLPKEELYDLNTDRWMVNNLIGKQHQADLPFLKKQLTNWRKLSGDTPANLKRRTKKNP